MTGVIPQLPSVGNRVRLALQYGGRWRPLIWVRCGRDGSLYAGLLSGRPTVAIEGEVHPGPGPKRVDYRQGRRLDTEDLPPSSRISFKASGEVHLGNRTAKGFALESLSRPTQLCLAVFSHPSRYREPERASPNDYDIGIKGYPVDEGRPLYGALIVEPWNGALPVAARRLPSMTYALDTVLAFGGLTRTPDLALHVVIGYGIEGEWPRLPSVALLSQVSRHDTPERALAAQPGHEPARAAEGSDHS